MQNRATAALRPSSPAEGGENRVSGTESEHLLCWVLEVRGVRLASQALLCPHAARAIQLSAALASLQGHIFAAPENSRTQLSLS